MNIQKLIILLLLYILGKSDLIAQELSNSYYEKKKMEIGIDGNFGISQISSTYTVSLRLSRNFQTGWTSGLVINLGNNTKQSSIASLSERTQYFGGGVFSRYYLLQKRFSIFSQASFCFNNYLLKNGNEGALIISPGVGISYLVGKKQNGAIALTVEKPLTSNENIISILPTPLTIGYHFIF